MADTKRGVGKALGDTIEMTFLFLEMSAPTKKNALTRGLCKECNISYFNELEMFFDTDETSQWTDSQTSIAFPSDCKPGDIEWNHFDVAAAVYRNDCISMFRGRSVGIKACRGKGRILSQFVMEMSTCEVDTTSELYESRVDLLNLGGSNKWRVIGEKEQASSRYRFTDPDNRLTRSVDGREYFGSEYDDSPNILLAIAFVRDLEWRVVLKSDTGRSVSILTSAHGARELLKDRDPGISGRREALRHWVTEHYRRRTDSTGCEKLIEVARHLRGRIPFSWHSMRGEIVVSPMELRMAEKKRKS